jgi:hypothetical protein
MRFRSGDLGIDALGAEPRGRSSLPFGLVRSRDRSDAAGPRPRILSPAGTPPRAASAARPASRLFSNALGSRRPRACEPRDWEKTVEWARSTCERGDLRDPSGPPGLAPPRIGGPIGLLASQQRMSTRRTSPRRRRPRTDRAPTALEVLLSSSHARRSARRACRRGSARPARGRAGPGCAGRSRAPPASSGPSPWRP